MINLERHIAHHHDGMSGTGRADRHYYRLTAAEIISSRPSAQTELDGPLQRQLHWWLNHLSKNHHWLNTVVQANVRYATQTFGFIANENERVVRIRQSDQVVNAVALQQSLFPGAVVAKKGCSDGREKKAVFAGKTFPGVKGPGGVPRVTEDGEGMRLASEVLCGGIRDATDRRAELVEVFVGHESKLRPVIKGCAAQNAAFELAHGRKPRGFEARNFTRQEIAHKLRVFDDHVNDERSYRQLAPLARASVVAYRNTDDLSVSLCDPNDGEEFDIATYALTHRDELDAQFRQRHPIFDSHEIFRRAMFDPGSIPVYEEGLAVAMEDLVTRSRFVTDLQAYRQQNSLRSLTDRQFMGLATFMARNLAIVHGSGYVHDNAQHASETGYYPDHPLSEHREMTLVISRRGKHPGIGCPDLQFLLSTPETTRDAVNDVALLGKGVIGKYSPDPSHPLIIADTDVSRLRTYAAAVINAAELQALFRTGYMLPIPVLTDENRSIKGIGVVL